LSALKNYYFFHWLKTVFFDQYQAGFGFIWCRGEKSTVLEGAQLMLQDTGDDAMKQAGFDKFIRFSLVAVVGPAYTGPK